MLGLTAKGPAAAVLLLALSQTAVAENSLRQAAALDCSGSKPSDGTVYESGQHSYDILCGQDYVGGDIGAGNADTFEDCIALCDTTPGCIDVSYAQPGCWMKNTLNAPAAARDNVWTARRADLSVATSLSCNEPGVDGTVYTAPGGSQFKILCGKDYAGGDMGGTYTENFAGCIDACEAAAGCVDVSYVGGACYLKNKLNALNDAGYVWTGVRVDALSPPANTATDGTATATASTSPSASASPLSCVDKASDGLEHTTPSGATYDIICGKEYAGGDLRGVGANTFEDCLASCDAEAACIDVSYVPGFCYMKQAKNGPLIEAGIVWTAVKKASTGGTGPTPGTPDLFCIDGQPTQATFATGNNRLYQILCGVDFTGGDMSATTATTFDGCLKACDEAAGCISVGYVGTTCYLKNRLRPKVTAAHVWSALYIGAPSPAESSSTVPAAAGTTTTSTPSSSVPVSVAPTSTQGNSPPLQTNNVYIPEFDDSWTSRYTYTEVALPTYTGTPTQDPIPTPSVVKTCFIEPESDTQFHLISPDMGYVIAKGNAPGFLSQPETEEEGLAILNMVADFKPPIFVFETPAGAPEGVYDIAYISGDAKRYIAVAADGEMSFASASTGAAGVNGQATTVFGVTCDGYITVTVGGATKNWRATEAGKTTLEGAGEPSKDGIRLLPTDAVPVNPNSVEAANQSAARLRRRAWDGMGQDGYAPRCPNTPRNVWPRVRNGARGTNPNGCGPANGFDFVPDWNFGGCCNDHDNCFDDCENKTFERCNLDFLGCMSAACVRDYSRWYNSWLQPGCLGMAGFYFAAVSSWKGKEAFNTANGERCECYCRTANTLLCSNNCVSISSNPSHCGGCNRTCPPGTRCQGLGCVCEKHQCGNTCLDLANHPRNCGSCGTVCASGFCYQGKCYDPPANPDRCYPREAFENGDFQRGNGDQWRVGGSSSTVTSKVYLGVFDGAASPDPYGMVMDFPTGSDGWATISQDVHLCAGQNYELNFKARRVYGDGNCMLTAVVGGRTVQNWVPLSTTGASWTKMGPYRLSPFQLGQSGVWQGPKFYLQATFTVTVLCTGPRNQWSTVRMDGFSIAPV